MVAVTTVGSGPDRIVLNVSEDAYLGDAMFTVAVDGQQIGGVQTAVVSHALREQQSFYIDGSLGAGSHTLTVDFLNDLYAGTPGTDRNLFVDRVQSGGEVLASGLAFYSAGKQSVAVQVPPQPVTIGTGNDTISLGSYWVPGWCRVRHATRPAMSVPSRALPRRRALCTNWKKPR